MISIQPDLILLVVMAMIISMVNQISTLSKVVMATIILMVAMVAIDSLVATITIFWSYAPGYSQWWLWYRHSYLITILVSNQEFCRLCI
nr:hypothetical protein [Okeania sp. SIO2F4]